MDQRQVGIEPARAADQTIFQNPTQIALILLLTTDASPEQREGTTVTQNLSLTLWTPPHSRRT